MGIEDASLEFVKGMEPDTHSPGDKWNLLLGDDRPEAKVKKQEDLQREFAQHGIRWKVADAVAAGINPAVALGASTHSYSPMAVMSSGPPPRSPGADSFAAMGQGLIGAMARSQTPEQKMMTALQLKNAHLQNEYLASQIRQINNSGPGFPGNDNFIPGQGNSGPGTLANPQPLNKVVTQPGRRGQDPSSINDYGFVQTPTGLAVVPSKDAKERIEDQLVPETMWAIRNQVLPAIKGHTPPDPKYYPLPAGYDRWKWNPWKQEFQPARSPRLHWENHRKGRY